MTDNRPSYCSFFLFDSVTRLHDRRRLDLYIDHIRFLAGLGYAGVELHTIRTPEIDATFPGYDDETAAYARLREQIVDAGLADVAVATNTGTTPTTDVSSDDPAIRESGRAYLMSRVDIAEALRAEVLMGPVVVPYGAFVRSAPNGEQVWSDDLQSELARRYRNAAPVLDEVGRYAESKRVKIAIEPITHWETPGPNTLAQLLDLLSLIPSPQVGAVVDSAHETLDGAGPEIFAEQVRMLADAGRLHYAQASPPDRGNLAAGWLPWMSLFQPLLAHYRGPVAIEIFNAVPDFAAGLRLSRPKYWVPGVDEPSDRPSAYDVARQSLETLRARFRPLDAIDGPEPLSAPSSLNAESSLT